MIKQNSKLIISKVYGIGLRDIGIRKSEFVTKNFYKHCIFHHLSCKQYTIFSLFYENSGLSYIVLSIEQSIFQDIFIAPGLPGYTVGTWTQVQNLVQEHRSTGVT